MNKNGQAIVEFVVALIPLLALVAGLVQLGMLTNAHTEAMVEARRRVANRMIVTSLGSAARDYYADWDNGHDGVSYSADDEAQEGNVRALRTALTVPAHTEELEARVGGNLISDLTIDPYLILWGLEQGEHSETVPVLPIARSLFYADDEIEVAAEVWMPAIGGDL